MVELKNIKILFGVVFLALLFLSGCISSDSSINESGEQLKVTLYKSPSCGCCSGYASYLSGKGFEVETVQIQDMNSIKNQFGVPSNMDSCHTTVIGDYFVEGHVPIEAVEKLLSEKPDIDGIALPDMPSGSPGMPGPQNEPYIIYSIKDGVMISEFMVIG